jgi:hypothetical protein
MSLVGLTDRDLLNGKSLPQYMQERTRVPGEVTLTQDEADKLWLEAEMRKFDK